MSSEPFYQKQNKQSATAVLCIVLLCCLSSAVLPIAATSAAAKGKKVERWEPHVRKGNEYLERGRSPDAIKYYQLALRILEKRRIDDVRKALVLNDIGEAYRAATKVYLAKLEEVKATAIYKKEIETHQLGLEYSTNKPIDFNSGSLRPLCYLCHENWKVVPILYGKSSGYANDVIPSEDDSAYTHKPGGTVIGDQRWYCRDCHQSF